MSRKRNIDRQHRKCGPAWVQGAVPQSRIHPTQKPVDIFVELIGFREDWQRICDPFGGSGTAILAAEQLGRQCVAIEKSRHYYTATCDRLRAATTA